MHGMESTLCAFEGLTNTTIIFQLQINEALWLVTWLSHDRFQERRAEEEWTQQQSSKEELLHLLFCLKQGW